MVKQAVAVSRFEVLDSWRGICALLVALFHFHALSHFRLGSFISNSFLFVDFFFVLSGFVIAANYQARLAEGFGIKRFMLLRFGRIYPLHLFTFLAFVIAEVFQNMPPFAAPMHSFDTMFTQIFLLQSFNLYSYLTWNVPSWSIATEFWTYLVFALAVIYVRRFFNVLALATIIICLSIIYVFSINQMNVSYDLGLFRCLAGFAVGGLCWAAWQRYLSRVKLSLGVGSILEILMAVNVIAFVTRAAYTQYSILAPLIFAVAVLVFAAEQGLISRILKTVPLLFLGSLSYSIYMTHYFIEAQISHFIVYAESHWGWAITSLDQTASPPETLIGTSLWQGDAWTIALVAVLIGISTLSYKLVEIPSRNWFRNRAQG